jgi:cytidyltransferase-like protein
MSDKLVAVSGGFDLLHIGHLRMMKEAAQYCNPIVILNSDFRIEMVL